MLLATKLSGDFLCNCSDPYSDFRPKDQQQKETKQDSEAEISNIFNAITKTKN